MNYNPYKQLAERLDALPNGFPPTLDGAELRLLEKLFTPNEAALAANLRFILETPAQIAGRFNSPDLSAAGEKNIKSQLKSMARKGLIAAGRTNDGLGYGLMPFVVGIYEAQAGRIDAELAQLFEDYYLQAFGQALTIKPAFHRVVPIKQSIRIDMEVRPYESASEIIENANAWGVMECICRVQKALIGDPCNHPVEVCMIFSRRPSAFDHSSVIHPLTREQAQDTLRQAAVAGLVHSVSNTQEGTFYICNCCTCSCGILRGMADLGIANVVARSAFINHVDEDLCTGCEDCLKNCQFNALSIESGVVKVNQIRCVGCGACIQVCLEDALSLIRLPEDVIPDVPENSIEWRSQRAAHRGMDLKAVL